MWMVGRRHGRTIHSDSGSGSEEKLNWWSRPEDSELELESESKPSWCRSLIWLDHPHPETIILSAKQPLRAFQKPVLQISLIKSTILSSWRAASNQYHLHVTTRWSWPLCRGIVVHVSQSKAASRREHMTLWSTARRLQSVKENWKLSYGLQWIVRSLTVRENYWSSASGRQYETY